MEWHSIIAKDLQGAIGKNGTLPWHIPSELKHFKNLTFGHAIVVGRTTFESFKSPLPGRDNLVLSTIPIQATPPVYFFTEKEQLIKFCQEQQYDKVFICGGASIYKLFQPEITTWHVTQVNLTVDGADTFWDQTNLKDFKKNMVQDHVDEKTRIEWQYQCWIK